MKIISDHNISINYINSHGFELTPNMTFVAHFTLQNQTNYLFFNTDRKESLDYRVSVTVSQGRAGFHCLAEVNSTYNSAIELDIKETGFSDISLINNASGSHLCSIINRNNESSVIKVEYYTILMKKEKHNIRLYLMLILFGALIIVLCAKIAYNSCHSEKNTKQKKLLKQLVPLQYLDVIKFFESIHREERKV